MLISPRPRHSVSIAGQLLAVLLTAAPAAVAGQASTASTDLALRAAVETLDFHEDSLASLTDARRYFTPAGWTAFLRRLTGFVNADGSPTYSSHFTPTGGLRSASPDAAHIRVSIAGTLVQSHQKPPRGRTTYRAVVDVTMRRDSGKIDALTTSTCGGARKKRACL